jgi:plasmid stability protein
MPASILQAMPTLYVRDVPSDLYERLRQEAASTRRSLSAETIELLRRSLVPRSGVSLEQLLEGADRIRADHAVSAGSPTAAELIREDRDR